MSRFYGWVVAVAVMVAALFFLGRASERAGKEAERARIAEEQAQVAHAGFRLAREQYDSAVAKTVRVERELYRERIKSQRFLQSADSTVAETHQVSQDTAATVFQLRGALVVQVATTERLAADFRAYLAQDSVAHYSWGVERAASVRALARADSALSAKDGVIRALRKAGTCKVLWFSCPTRSQVLAGTALVTAGVITLARD